MGKRSIRLTFRHICVGLLASELVSKTGFGRFDS